MTTLQMNSNSRESVHRVKKIIFCASIYLAQISIGHSAEVDYLRDIKPLLEHKCYACHGGLKQKAGLRLDTSAFMHQGGESGAAITAGEPASSLILKRITSSDESKRMPRDASALKADEIDLLERWIALGASAPADEVAMEDPRSHWSYQIARKPTIPKTKDPSRIRNPIDAFITAEREKHNLIPAQPAEKSVLLRRLYLDLIGIPPSDKQLHDFQSNNDPMAYEQTVENLLQSPLYGQRWGRHWMDVWRYSDWYGSRGGNEIRYSVRHIWRWRDWIVESVNADKGYDRMVMEMLAGDELAPTDPGALAATGYLGRNWYKFNRNIWLFDTVETTSQALLGLTMRCARCHNHKYDPVSQEEYYRFRAFFEPHDVRTDKVKFATAMEKDAKTTPILADGLSRVFDSKAETPTYRFIRGDDRYPDETKKLSPGVPAAFKGKGVTIKAVTLPAEAFYPALRENIVTGMIAQAQSNARDASKKVAIMKIALSTAEKQLTNFKGPDQKGASKAFFEEDFAKKTAAWKPVNGSWKFEDNLLRQDQVTGFATIVHQKIQPRNFRLKLRYRTLAEGITRSVGVSFDYIDKGQSQDVYTSTAEKKQSVQAFHRTGGKQIYPPSGVVKTELKTDEETTLELEVRGPILKIWLNGVQKHDYVMPTSRRNGKLALWVHSGNAEFLELELRPLPVTREGLVNDLRAARMNLAEAQKSAKAASLEAAVLRKRVQAERANYTKPQPNNIKALAQTASRAEAELKLYASEAALLQTEERVALSKLAKARFTFIANADPVIEAEKAFEQARQQLATAKKTVTNPSGKYETIGEKFPETSTGRRLALARWIASPENPRTARVAVNHIWMRHFGEPLVASVSNFGPSGKAPTHPELLDWLAIELTESNWSMKRLHQLMVTSATYRMASWSGAESTSNKAADPDNKFYWRMNSRRMEAETVRDSILSIGGALDVSPGGPDLDPKLSSQSKRRSLYFRTTPDDQPIMLSLFNAASPNACYRREEGIVPQQALVLMNSGLSLDQSRLLAKELSANANNPTLFARSAFEKILGRTPNPDELSAMTRFLSSTGKNSSKSEAYAGNGESKILPSKDSIQRARENLVHVLFNHNDFVTIR